MKSGKIRPLKRPFFFGQGKLYFSNATERRVFFYLTVGMAALGLMIRYGILT